MLSSSWHFCVYFWGVQAFLFHLDSPLVEEIWRFLFFTWQHSWSVTWLFGWGPFILSEHPTKFCGPWSLWMWRPNFFDLSRDHMNDVSRDFRLGFLILSCHSAKFGVHKPCESGDITFLICHVTTISKCHVTLWVGSPLFKSPTGYVWGP